MSKYYFIVQGNDEQNEEQRQEIIKDYEKQYSDSKYVWLKDDDSLKPLESLVYTSADGKNIVENFVKAIVNLKRDLILKARISKLQQKFTEDNLVENIENAIWNGFFDFCINGVPVNQKNEFVNRIYSVIRGCTNSFSSSLTDSDYEKIVNLMNFFYSSLNGQYKYSELRRLDNPSNLENLVPAIYPVSFEKADPEPKNLYLLQALAYKTITKYFIYGVDELKKDPSEYTPDDFYSGELIKTDWTYNKLGSKEDIKDYYEFYCKGAESIFVIIQ